MEKCSQMIKYHPEMILISENPVTWKGFLIIDTNLGFVVDITLVVPHYPRLTDVELSFGESKYLLHGTNFPEKLHAILKHSTTVPSLLIQLKRTVMNLLKEKYENFGREATNFQGDTVKQIKAALQSNSPVEISARRDLKALKLSIQNVSVVMQKDFAANSWKIISSDLPESPWLEPFDTIVGNLDSAMFKLQTRVEMLTDAWNQLEEIDHTCWVVDPPEPKPYHLYRRIHLTESLSALITINPVDVFELPDIKLLGSSAEVAKYRNIMTSNLLKWDKDSSIIDNLRILLAIDELPEPPEGERKKDEHAIVEDDECCICFAMELDDGTPAVLPVEICNNDKCRKHFHTLCLQKWLQSIAENQVSFDIIHGTCPNCSESISCPLSRS